ARSQRAERQGDRAPEARPRGGLPRLRARALGPGLPQRRRRPALPGARPAEVAPVSRPRPPATTAQEHVAIVANSEDAALHNRLGICYQRMGNAKEARRAYKKALDLCADYAEAWNNLGTLDHAGGRYKRAIEAYSRAIRLEPHTAVFHKNL